MPSAKVFLEIHHGIRAILEFLRLSLAVDGVGDPREFVDARSRIVRAEHGRTINAHARLTRGERVLDVVGDVINPVPDEVAIDRLVDLQLRGRGGRDVGAGGRRVQFLPGTLDLGIHQTDRFGFAFADILLPEEGEGLDVARQRNDLRSEHIADVFRFSRHEIRRVEGLERLLGRREGRRGNNRQEKEGSFHGGIFTF